MIGLTKNTVLLIAFFLPLVCLAQSADDELVKVKELIPDIVLDLKYDGVDNFTGQKLYTTDACFLALNAAKRLILVQDSLRKITEHNGTIYPEGLGLKIWDGYRPRAVQYLMWEIVPNPAYVADPSNGSSHNRGAAIDVTLIDRSTGQELTMPTYFDDFSEAAHHSYTNLPADVIANRELLEDLMISVGGFSPYSAEWWHYSYPPAKDFPLVDFQLK